MPSPSHYKQFVSALSNPHEAARPRLDRRVVTFEEKLEELKSSQASHVRCAAILTYGQCDKLIPIVDSHFLRAFDRDSMAEIEIPTKIIPFMLCPTHWPMTVFYIPLLLGCLSLHGMTQDSQIYQNIVTDYCSAINMDGQLSAPARNSLAAIDDGHIVPDSSISEGYSDINQASGEQTENIVSSQTSVITFTQPEATSDNSSGNSTIRNVESYATLELGVAKIEIIYQESLNCIAMTLAGWRCQEHINKERLLKARELLNWLASGDNKFDFGCLSRLVLCEVHLLGKLPELYANKWAISDAQRLPRGEAISWFDADYWNNELKKSSSSQRRIRTARAKRTPSSRENSGSSIFAGMSSQPSQFDFSMPSSVPRSPLHGRSAMSHDAALSDMVGRLTVSETPSATNSISDSVDPDAPTTINSSDPRSMPSSPDVTDGIDHEVETPSGIDRGTSSTELPESTSDPSIAELPLPSLQQEFPPSLTSTPSHTAANRSNGEVDSQSPEPGVATVPYSSQEAPLYLAPAMHQSIVDRNIIAEIKKSIPQGGYVYIFKSKSQKLLKIGRSADPDARKRQIAAECRIDDLEYAEHDCHFIKNPERVEMLVHLELRYFRKPINCLHSKKNGQSTECKHREWFDVPDQVASNSVDLWSTFVELAYTSQGTIKEHWATMTDLLPKPCEIEKTCLKEGIAKGSKWNIDQYHRIRQERYRRWVERGEKPSG